MNGKTEHSAESNGISWLNLAYQLICCAYHMFPYTVIWHDNWFLTIVFVVVVQVIPDLIITYLPAQPIGAFLCSFIAFAIRGGDLACWIIALTRISEISFAQWYRICFYIGFGFTVFRWIQKTIIAIRSK